MYRGQDIGDRDQLVATCIEILRSGSEAERYKILPHVSVTRCKRFLEPLLKLLGSDTPEDKEFAALALGALGDPAAIDPLFAVLQDSRIFNKGGNRSLEAAVILTLGEIGHEKAVALLLQVYDLRYFGEPSSHNRKVNVLSALGLLAQQGSESAVGELLTLAARGGFRPAGAGRHRVVRRLLASSPSGSGQGSEHDVQDDPGRRG